jgi:hypothetical protein
MYSVIIEYNVVYRDKKAAIHSFRNIRVSVNSAAEKMLARAYRGRPSGSKTPKELTRKLSLFLVVDTTNVLYYLWTLFLFRSIVVARKQQVGHDRRGHDPVNRARNDPGHGIRITLHGHLAARILGQHAKENGPIKRH